MSKHIVIVGGGPAGYVAALHARDRGADVTLVGGGDLGGTCLWRGCIPTKSLVASARLLSQVRHGAQFGLTGGEDAAADWHAMRARAQRISENNAKGIKALLEDRSVQLVTGHARFVAKNVLVTEVGEIVTDHILLCTGSRPLVPSGFCVDGERIGTSDDLLRWETLPASLLIVGGGVIACEFAFILAAIGVKVIMLERFDSPLPGEEPELRRVLMREMKKRGIRFIGGVTIERLQVNGDSVDCHVDGRVLVQADRALLAVGRSPFTGTLDVARAGLETDDRGRIGVDDHQRTAVPGIYAAGDVTGGLMLAHNASLQARVAVNHMLGLNPDTVASIAIPRVTFSDPEVASIGLTEQAACGQYGDSVRTGSFDLRALGMAHALGELAGLVKVVIEGDAGRVLGIHIIGAHASEMINEASVIVNNRITVDALLNSVHAHPTLSEAIAEAAEAALHGYSSHQFGKRPSRGANTRASL